MATERGRLFILATPLGNLKDISLRALEVLKEKGYSISEPAVREGLKGARWPGRLEIVRKEPCVLLDGAHNPSAMKKIRESLDQDFTYRRIFLVLGIMVDKDVSRIIREIAPLAHKVILTRPHMDRSAPPPLLRKYVERYCTNVEERDEVKDAVDSAVAQAGKNDLVLITGSLFTVGEARAHLCP